MDERDRRAAADVSLAGINNQNFLMRDDETGTYWQQISGKAMAGPLSGSQLVLVHSDELTFGAWRSEEPQGTVLQDAARYRSEYSPMDWDAHMQRYPTVIDFREHGLHGRDRCWACTRSAPGAPTYMTK